MLSKSDECCKEDKAESWNIVVEEEKVRRQAGQGRPLEQEIFDISIIDITSENPDMKKYDSSSKIVYAFNQLLFTKYSILLYLCTLFPKRI